LESLGGRLGADSKTGFCPSPNSAEALSALGRQAEPVAPRLLGLAGERLGSQWPYEVCVLDDSPTKRCGPQVEGAGQPHHPTPGPVKLSFSRKVQVWFKWLRFSSSFFLAVVAKACRCWSTRSSKNGSLT